MKIGLEDRDLINPPYAIANEAGGISNKTIDTDIVHAGEGYAEYDTHNLYGTSMFILSSTCVWLSNKASDELGIP
jgi:alpha-glucosidase